MSEVQKDLEVILAEIDIYKKHKLFYKFSCYFRSKSVRSTLTSPGPIRVKELIVNIIIYDTLQICASYCEHKKAIRQPVL
jgi:hypothetical protein